MTKPKPKHQASVQELARRLQVMPPARQLEAAVRLMDAGDVEIAIAIVENVVVMHQAAQLGFLKP